MEVAENVPLAPLTTWRIGGPARYFVEPSCARELCEALDWAREQTTPVVVLGRGSNVLVSDDGFDGLVISTRGLTELRVDSESGLIVAGAGVSLPRLCKFAAAQGWGGYEWLIGIPGSVGGAIIMNAGFKKGDPRETRAVVQDFNVVSHDGTIERSTMEQVHAGYRHTDLQGADRVVVDARFRCIGKSDTETIRALTKEHLAERKEKQPLTRPTAGSVFAAVEDGTPAAVFIDRAGLKGFSIGGAQISEKHANWIENTGNATARDVSALIEHVQEVVERQFGHNVKPEIQRIG